MPRIYSLQSVWVSLPGRGRSKCHRQQVHTGYHTLSKQNHWHTLEYPWEKEKEDKGVRKDEDGWGVKRPGSKTLEILNSTAFLIWYVCYLLCNKYMSVQQIAINSCNLFIILTLISMLLQRYKLKTFLSKVRKVRNTANHPSPLYNESKLRQ